MRHGSHSVTAMAAVVALLGAATPAAKAVTKPSACPISHETIYVGATGKLDGQQTMTPVNATTGQAGHRIKAGSSRGEIAIAPGGKTGYVANSYADTVTPIDLCQSKALKPIKVGKGPDAIAMAPDGRTAYVASRTANTLTPIDTATGATGKPIALGLSPRFVLITPDGKYAYVSGHSAVSGHSVTSLITAVLLKTGTPLAPIKIRGHAEHFVLAPGGKTAYLVSLDPGTVTPVSTVTAKAGRPISVQGSPSYIAIKAGSPA
jgi:hyaluronoglucosaminidase